jgi:hypothetical protein
LVASLDVRGYKGLGGAAVESGSYGCVGHDLELTFTSAGATLDDELPPAS